MPSTSQLTDMMSGSVSSMVIQIGLMTVFFLFFFSLIIFNHLLFEYCFFNILNNIYILFLMFVSFEKLKTHSLSFICVIGLFRV